MDANIYIQRMHTTDKGVVGELMIASRLAQQGYTVLRPFTENSRYDLVFERKGSFYRVQCKTGRIRNGVVQFNTTSTSKFVQYGKHIPYYNQVDYIGVYCQDNDNCYLVPINQIPLGKGHLRIDPSKNNQKKFIRAATDFLINVP